MKTLILLSTLPFLFLSCGSSPKDIHEQQKKEMKELKTKTINNLVSKYGITYKLDTIDLIDHVYSIDFKTLINSRYQLIDRFEISDIYEKDSIEFITVKSGTYPTLYLELEITKDQEKQFRDESKEIILVVSINYIRKLKIMPDEEYNDESSTIILDNSSDFTGKGKLIEIATFKPQNAK